MEVENTGPLRVGRTGPGLVLCEGRPGRQREHPGFLPWPVGGPGSQTTPRYSWVVPCPLVQSRLPGPLEWNGAVWRSFHRGHLGPRRWERIIRDYQTFLSTTPTRTSGGGRGRRGYSLWVQSTRFYFLAGSVLPVSPRPSKKDRA